MCKKHVEGGSYDPPLVVGRLTHYYYHKYIELVFRGCRHMLPALNTEQGLTLGFNLERTNPRSGMEESDVF